MNYEIRLKPRLMPGNQKANNAAELTATEFKRNEFNAG